jgi:diguanylate cyclase (GGDEF)-like protein/PAS domain S-box-containing protein
LQSLSPEIFREIVDRIETGVYAVDLSGKILYWNHGAERITGFLGPQVLGRGCNESILAESDEQHPGREAPIYQTKTGETGGAPLEQIKHLRHRSGHVVAVRQWTMVMRDPQGRIAGAVMVFSEPPVIAERAMSEHGQDLDPETGAVSREATEKILRLQMKVANQQHKVCGLIAIRLDRMKDFRAAHGSEAANTMLRVMSQTLSDMARRSDVVGRWDGDSFLAVLPGCAMEPLERVAARMRRVAERVAIPWWGERLTTSVAVRLTIMNQDDTVESIETRLSRPETALRNPEKAEAGA